MMGLENRSSRERILIVVAAVLFAFFMLWQFVLNPAFDMRADANKAYNKAVRDHDIVNRAAPYLGDANAADQNREAFNRAALVNIAASQNITIARLQPGSENVLQAWFEQNTSTEIFTFLSAIQLRYNVEITRVQMQRRANNIVSAQISFTPITNIK